MAAVRRLLGVLVRVRGTPGSHGLGLLGAWNREAQVESGVPSSPQGRGQQGAPQCPSTQRAHVQILRPLQFQHLPRKHPGPHCFPLDRGATCRPAGECTVPEGEGAWREGGVPFPPQPGAGGPAVTWSSQPLWGQGRMAALGSAGQTGDWLLCEAERSQQGHVGSAWAPRPCTPSPAVD